MIEDIMPGRSIGKYELGLTADQLKIPTNLLDSQGVIEMGNWFRLLFDQQVLSHISYSGKDFAFAGRIKVGDKVEKLIDLFTDAYFDDDEEVFFLSSIPGICFEIDDINEEDEGEGDETDFSFYIITSINVFR